MSGKRYKLEFDGKVFDITLNNRSKAICNQEENYLVRRFDFTVEFDGCKVAATVDRKIDLDGLNLRRECVFPGNASEYFSQKEIEAIFRAFVLIIEQDDY